MLALQKSIDIKRNSLPNLIANAAALFSFISAYELCVVELKDLYIVEPLHRRSSAFLGFCVQGFGQAGTPQKLDPPLWK